MEEQKELKCIDALNNLFAGRYGKDEYSTNGPKDSAVCIEKIDSKWAVYEKEKSSKNDYHDYDNVVEACLDMIARMAFGDDIVALKNEFLNAIVGIKTA